MTRNGKIARLPQEIRETLNQRLEDGEDGGAILNWINGLCEVKKILEEQFKGVPISKQNLSEWRAGGFREWQISEDLAEKAARLRETTPKVTEADGKMRCFADDLVYVMTLRYAALLAEWDGQASPEFEAKCRIHRVLSQDLLKLQRGVRDSVVENYDLVKLQRQYEHSEEWAAMWRTKNPLATLMKKYGVPSVLKRDDADDELDEDEPVTPDPKDLAEEFDDDSRAQSEWVPTEVDASSGEEAAKRPVAEMEEDPVEVTAENRPDAAEDDDATEAGARASRVFGVEESAAVKPGQSGSNRRANPPAPISIPTLGGGPGR